MADVDHAVVEKGKEGSSPSPQFAAPAETAETAKTASYTTSSDPREQTARPRNNANGNMPRAEGVEPTKFGQAYSERNPAPNLQTFQVHQREREEASRRYFEEDTKDRPPTREQQKEKEKEKESPTSRASPTIEDGAKAGATADVPIGAEKSNVLFLPTPAIKLDRVFETLERDAMQVGYVVSAAIVLLDWLFIGGGWQGFFKSLFPAFGVAIAVYYILINVGESAAKTKLNEVDPKTEKLRYAPESTEWLNSLLETLWHTLQQDFFDNIASQANDTIKTLVPEGVPATVKLTGIGHGCRPVRVLSMRSLPDSEFGDLVPTHGVDKSGSKDSARAREKAAEEEEGGVFYNLEVAIVYHEAPMRTRKDQMHADILATIGPVPVPVYVQVKEFVATIRIRLQMHADLPFLKHMTFALTENPKINACVSLGATWALDLLNLPIIDNLIVSQIDQAAADFVQPKSMRMDMTIYVGGSDQKLDTEAIGVLCVKIHRARNLARQDSRGAGADPYLTIAFSKYEKPMYATRIIKGDRNPVWEETAIILIRSEHVKRQENVLLRLWDSDTTGSDDVSGVCEVSLQELVLKANQMQKREDQLQGDVAGTDAEGVLEWEIGYFPRAEWEKALRTDAKDPRDHHGEKIEVKEEEKQQDALNTVPDPNLPTGILALTVHQCINVKVENPNKASMGHLKVRKQDSDGEDNSEEEEVSVDYIPSLYVTVNVNDKLVYRTRVKSINKAPTFNSSTETCVRDWRMADLTFSVWDTRKKAPDCLVGVVSLKMSQIFDQSSSVAKFYDLKGGEGSGRIRVSMIFRSMRMKLEESLLGYDVGSFVFTSPITCTGSVNTSKLRLRTSGTERSIKSSSGSSSDEAYIWKLSEEENIIPVIHRYMAPLVLEFRNSGVGPMKSKHYAIMWLYNIIDNEASTFKLPIYKTNNPNRLLQNVVHEADDKMSLEKIGEVTFDGRFSSGLDESHKEFLQNHDIWCAYKSWEAAKKSGQREDHVLRDINKVVEKLAQGIKKTQSIHV